jgi:uncharacterized protein YutE (UPF0331/DUF86 family)
MTSLHIIENKLAAVRKFVDQLITYRKLSSNQIQHDATLRGAVERYLYLAAQATIDAAEATIAYRGYRKPTSNRECFEVLFENGVLTQALTENLVKMAAFRNMLSHAYDRIDFDIVTKVLADSLSDLDEFILAIKKSV